MNSYSPTGKPIDANGSDSPLAGIVSQELLSDLCSGSYSTSAKPHKPNRFYSPLKMLAATAFLSAYTAFSAYFPARVTAQEVQNAATENNSGIVEMYQGSKTPGIDCLMDSLKNPALNCDELLGKVNQVPQTNNLENVVAATSTLYVPTATSTQAILTQSQTDVYGKTAQVPQASGKKDKGGKVIVYVLGAVALYALISNSGGGSSSPVPAVSVTPPVTPPVDDTLADPNADTCNVLTEMCGNDGTISDDVQTDSNFTTVE
ncbi:MAG: hypothetical protein Q8O89_04815 [Nanoarchaeota archaeon]|nr:hypothetical protein [Nanoarchaeota archaeon]